MNDLDLHWAAFHADILCALSGQVFSATSASICIASASASSHRRGKAERKVPVIAPLLYHMYICRFLYDERILSYTAAKFEALGMILRF